jgi:hypothetical protein
MNIDTIIKISIAIILLYIYSTKFIWIAIIGIILYCLYYYKIVDFSSITSKIIKKETKTEQLMYYNKDLLDKIKKFKKYNKGDYDNGIKYYKLFIKSINNINKYIYELNNKNKTINSYVKINKLKNLINNLYLLLNKSINYFQNITYSVKKSYKIAELSKYNKQLYKVLYKNILGCVNMFNTIAGENHIYIDNIKEFNSMNNFEIY